MALREILAKFGFEVDDSALKKANVNVDGLLSKVTNLKGVVAGALAGVGLGFLKGQIDELSKESGELNKAAIKTGVGFEQFQRLQYQTGLSTEQLTISFRNLQLGMASAGGAASDANEDFASLAEGGLDKIGKKKAGDAIKKLGVDINDGAGKARNSGDVFADTAKKLALVKDPAQRSALAIQIFGRGGQDILPFLAKGPEAIEELGAQFDTFGGITEENRKTLKRYEEEQKRLDLISKALRVTVLSALTPALTFLFQKFNEGITWIKKNVDTSQLLTSSFGVLTVAIVAFGGAAIVAWAKALIGPLLLGAAVLAVIAIVDDLIHFFKGDAKTATEDLIVLIFGKQAGESWIAQVRRDVHSFVEDMLGAKSVLEEFAKLLDFIAGGGQGRDASGAVVNTDVQLASRGVTRKALRKAKAGAAEGGVGEGERETVGPTLEQAGKSLYQRPAPVLTLSPVTVTGHKSGPTTIDAKQNVTINQTINGADAKDAADQSVDGVKGVLKNQHQATLNAVEARK